MPKVRKVAIQTTPPDVARTIQALCADDAVTWTDTGHSATVCQFPSPLSTDSGRPPGRTARDMARVAAALRRAGFLVGGERATAEVLDAVTVAKPDTVEVNFLPCGPEFGFRSWSGKPAAILEILAGMTDGSEHDERLAVTFFVTADDLPTAVAIDANLRSVTWRKSRTTLLDEVSCPACPATEPAVRPCEDTRTKPKARGIARR